MSDNVTPLKQPAPRIWICNCGCASFSLLEDGTAECAMCGETVSETDGAGWKGIKGESNTENPITDINGNGSIEFAKRRVESLASDADAFAIIVIKEGGAIHSWSMAEDIPQYECIAENVEVALRMIKGGIIAKGQEDGK